jgi:hypothetical protein
MKKKPFNQPIIRRKHEHEIKQAIKDLEERGFVLKYGPERQIGEGKVFNTDDHKRRVFQENTIHSMWVARLTIEN